MGVALRVVGVASRAESLVHVVTNYTGWLLLLILVWRVWLFQLNLISHYFQFPRGHFGHGKEFSQVGKMAFLQVFCHTYLMGFKLKRMKTSMRADPAFISSIAS